MQTKPKLDKTRVFLQGMLQDSIDWALNDDDGDFWEPWNTPRFWSQLSHPRPAYFRLHHTTSRPRRTPIRHKSFAQY